MAGMLPGVELAKRRRMHLRRQEESGSSSRRRFPLPGDWLSDTPTATATMDEAAIGARHRLDLKLGNFYSSHRLEEDRGRDHSGSSTKETLGSKILGRPWHFKCNFSRSIKKQVCAVCLGVVVKEDQQKLMSLPCSHKYHSKCLFPWLAVHPHCPSCGVLSSSSSTPDVFYG